MIYITLVINDIQPLIRNVDVKFVGKHSGLETIPSSISTILIQGNLAVLLHTHLALVVCMLRNQESSPRLSFPFPISPVVCPAYSGRGWWRHFWAIDYSICSQINLAIPVIDSAKITFTKYMYPARNTSTYVMQHFVTLPCSSQAVKYSILSYRYLLNRWSWKVWRYPACS